jgi:hypothetical protein
MVVYYYFSGPVQCVVVSASAVWTSAQDWTVLKRNNKVSLENNLDACLFAQKAFVLAVIFSQHVAFSLTLFSSGCRARSIGGPRGYCTPNARFAR